jgi:2-polyprenyl-3-methyl-5-hydroxy-6-metoxy-1,4-benzoquinol methylase
MHYEVDGKLISSELTARPRPLASRSLMAFLSTFSRVERVADYGCGKLRYASQLAAMAESLTLVDSDVQLERRQIIDGKPATVRTLARRLWPLVEIETITEFRSNKCPKFDFVLCANVLSAIPDEAARADALSAIRYRLKTTGSLLVVNQHTNSYYSQVARRKDVVRHLDGWLAPRNSSASYYGILDKKKTSQILEEEGYKILEHWIAGQSNYALAQIR